MRPNERRAEIIRIMTARRKTTVPQLAMELGVSVKTIRRDIEELTMEYPLETTAGNGGGISVPEWFHPHKNIFSREQVSVLENLMMNADEHQREVLGQMLQEYAYSHSPKL